VVLDRLRALGRDRSTVLRECRDCGTTLDDQLSECPTCGSSEIAAYEL
jgi:predicted Zn-ribbon and HTH transcriptional regulator